MPLLSNLGIIIYYSANDDVLSNIDNYIYTQRLIYCVKLYYAQKVAKVIYKSKVFTRKQYLYVHDISSPCYLRR